MAVFCLICFQSFIAKGVFLLTELEQIFSKEYDDLQQYRRNGMGLDVTRLPLPENAVKVHKYEAVFLTGITDKVYSGLNGTSAILFKGKLRRRMYDNHGLMHTKEGKCIMQDVPLHQGCAAVLSGLRLGVKAGYVPMEEGFECVDKVPCGDNIPRYLYEVPKEHLRLANMVALVLSLKAPRRFYEGTKLRLRTGYDVYLSIVPYRAGKYSATPGLYTVRTCTSYQADSSTYELSLLCAKIKDLWVHCGLLDTDEMTYIHSEGFSLSRVPIQSRGDLPEYTPYRKDEVLFDGTDNDIDIDNDSNLERGVANA